MGVRAGARVEPRLRPKQKILLLVVLIFLANTLLCGALSCYPRAINITPDERRYYLLAQSLARGQGLSIHNLESDFQKILYPLFISPAFLIRDVGVRLNLIGFLNALYMSSAVFPIYLLCRDWKLSGRMTICTALLSISMPDFAITAAFMSETVYFPLALWTVWLYSRAITSNRPRDIVLAGAVSWLLYLNKEIGVCYLLAYLCLILHKIFFSRTIRDKAGLAALLLASGSFLLPVLLTKLTVFRGMGNSYNQSDIGPIMSAYGLGYFFYAFLFYLLNLAVYFYIFPLLLPLLHVKEADRSYKDFLFWLFLTFVTIAAVAAYTISIREDLGALSPRLHMRYFFPFIPPLLIVCFHACDRMRERYDGRSTGGYRTYLAGLSALLGMAVFLGFRRITVGSTVDEFGLEIYRRFCGLAPLDRTITGGEGEWTLDPGLLLTRAGICAALAVGVWLLFRYGKERPAAHPGGRISHPFLSYLIAGIALINLINYGLKYQELRQSAGLSPAITAQLGEIQDFIGTLSGNILVIGDHDGHRDKNVKRLETYIESPQLFYVCAEELEFAQKYRTAGRDYLDLHTDFLKDFHSGRPYTQLDAADYIMISEELNDSRLRLSAVSCTLLRQIGEYRIYENHDPSQLHFGPAA